MLSVETRNAIDALSKEDLVQEIHKENRSRFQGDNYAYLKTRFALLMEQERAEQSAKELRLNADANEVAKEENEIVRESNAISGKAYRMAAFSVVVAVIAAIIALLPQCSVKP
ncbi:MAG: hypothetical protein NT115_02305 [Proteobacteria bacterium]|nr:hypothetical protein [Pseudomonadota bacterium]